MIDLIDLCCLVFGSLPDLLGFCLCGDSDLCGFLCCLMCIYYLGGFGFIVWCLIWICLVLVVLVVFQI